MAIKLSTMFSFPDTTISYYNTEGSCVYMSFYGVIDAAELITQVQTQLLNHTEYQLAIIRNSETGATLMKLENQPD